MTNDSTRMDIDFVTFHNVVNDILSSSLMPIAEISIQYLLQITTKSQETLYSIPELFKQYMEDSTKELSDSLNSLEPVLTYIRVHENLIDYEMTIDEAFEKISFVTPKEATLLGLVLSALSSLQNQDIIAFIAWILIALLTILANDPE